MGIIDLRIPGTYIVTFVIFIGIFGHFQNPAVGFFDAQYITAHLCGGGLCLVHGSWQRLCNMSDHAKGTIRVWNLAWNSDWTLPSVRRFRRGSFLCDHYQ